MRFLRLCSLLLVLFVCPFLLAQDGEKFVSGPQAGTFIPAPFECMNVNGPSKGRPRCLVCAFSLNPAVLIFAKEPVKGKDEAFNDLLKQMDDAAENFQDRLFSVGVVFLSPDARDSTNNSQEENSKEIIQEAVKREDLVKRLQERAEKLKHVIVAYAHPDNPVFSMKDEKEEKKTYLLNPKAEVTVIFYERMKIVENWAYPADGMRQKDVDLIMKRVTEALPLRKKAAEKQPKT